MIKFNNFAYMSAIALIGAVGFTACSSDDDITDPNPTFDGESVKTQFAINIPYANGGTRMSDEIVQEKNNFRGMQDIYLIPTPETPATNASLFETVINLPDFDDLDNVSSPSLGNYKLYNDVNIPVPTKNFLFYSQAGKETSATHLTNGVLETTLPNVTKAEDVTFKLKPILDETTKSTFSTRMSAIATVLTNVAKVNGWSSESGSDLADLYTDFKTMKAGSANSVKIALENLYNALSVYGTAHEKYHLVSQIKNAIAGTGNDNAPFTVAANAGGNQPDSVLTWKATYDANFPVSLGIPEGAAQVEWSDDNSGAFVASDAGGHTYGVKAEAICYPSALYYFVNTSVKANNSSDNITWPASSSAWANDTWSGWGDEVTSTTRAVALKDNVQYGVASLETTVKLASTSLADNGAKLGAGTNYITMPTGGFDLNSIIVGGQPSVVGYDMAGTTGTTYNQNVYDSIPGGKVTTTASAANYTLLLDDSTNVSNGQNNKVYFALELTNNSGTDFYGNDGLIAAGMKFYLIGELDPEAGTGVTTPYGTTPQSVFRMDYKTKANVTISSLKNAYVTIPDLRASQLVLGLSVDLTWEQGKVFDVVIE